MGGNALRAFLPIKADISIFFPNPQTMMNLEYYSKPKFC